MVTTTPCTWSSLTAPRAITSATVHLKLLVAGEGIPSLPSIYVSSECSSLFSIHQHVCWPSLCISCAAVVHGGEACRRQELFIVDYKQQGTTMAGPQASGNQLSTTVISTGTARRLLSKLVDVHCHAAIREVVDAAEAIVDQRVLVAAGSRVVVLTGGGLV